MKFLIFFIVLILLLVSAIVGGTYLIFNLLVRFGIQPGSKAWDNLVRKLRSKTEELGQQLIPWDKEMPTLLSLTQVDQKKGGGLSSEGHGIFTTIYQEPILAYANLKMKDGGIILARTSTSEFILRLKGKETEIWVNQQPFGVLVDGILLSAGKGSRQMARLETPKDELQFPLSMGEKIVATIANPERADAPNPRALTLLRDLSPEEENIVLAMTILKLVR